MTVQPTTNTSTSIGVRTAADGTRSFTVRTATTVSTDPATSFGRCLDRGREAACAQPELTPASGTTPTASTAGTDATASPATPTTTDDLLAQLRDLLQQLVDRMNERYGHAGSSGRTEHGCRPANPSPPSTATTPAHEAITCNPRPSRTFDVPATDPSASGSVRQIKVSGRIAAEPVAVGAKLDEGIRRIASFMDQVTAHLKAGGTFTEQQLADISDEAFGIYREAIRATNGENDLGDYSSPARDGVLDLGGPASSSAIAIAALVAASDPIAA